MAIGKIQESQGQVQATREIDRRRRERDISQCAHNSGSRPDTHTSPGPALPLVAVGDVAAKDDRLEPVHWDEDLDMRVCACISVR